MPTLEPLRLDHAASLLTFERVNRAFFAKSIPDRGDDFFTRFDALHAERLAEQDTGACRFHVLVDDLGAIVGRVNLVDIAGGEAELGYRIGEEASGHGLATNAVAEVRQLARRDYGLQRLRAKITVDNVASRKVLERNGFTEIERMELNGRPAIGFLLHLS